ncbi:MAG: sporulation protein YabP [Bacilli bacterium]
MDKTKELENFNHVVQIKERKNVLITGVKKVESFDEHEFFLETVMGHLLIKGNGLEMVKLDTFQGQLTLNGVVNSMNYLEDNGKKVKSESLVSKLFK